MNPVKGKTPMNATASNDDTALLQLPPRAAKPRRRGLTSVIDFGPDSFGWGGSVAGIRNLLDCAAEHIDYAKLYALNPLLMPANTVRASVRCYRDAGVTPYGGGILFEYAWQRNEIEGLIRLLRSLDLAAIEVSENCITLSREQRLQEIARLQQAGIDVIYEFGAKSPEVPLEFDDLAAIIADMGELGIEHITLEQSELDLLASERPGSMQALKAQPWFHQILIEADPYAFPAQHARIIQDFGPDVNLANITTGQVLRVEGFRRGIGRAVGFSLVSGYPPG